MTLTYGAYAAQAICVSCDLRRCGAHRHRHRAPSVVVADLPTPFLVLGLTPFSSSFLTYGTVRYVKGCIYHGEMSATNKQTNKQTQSRQTDRQTDGRVGGRERAAMATATAEWCTLHTCSSSPMIAAVLNRSPVPDSTTTVTCRVAPEGSEGHRTVSTQPAGRPRPVQYVAVRLSGGW